MPHFSKRNIAKLYYMPKSISNVKTNFGILEISPNLIYFGLIIVDLYGAKRKNLFIQSMDAYDVGNLSSARSNEIMDHLAILSTQT